MQRTTPPFRADHVGSILRSAPIKHAREQLGRVLGVAMKTLSERFQKVVLLYYTNELTMKEIGGMLGINESRVSQIHKVALQKMAVALHHRGIDSIHAFHY